MIGWIIDHIHIVVLNYIYHFFPLLSVHFFFFFWYFTQERAPVGLGLVAAENSGKATWWHSLIRFNISSFKDMWNRGEELDYQLCIRNYNSSPSIQVQLPRTEIEKSERIILFSFLFPVSMGTYELAVLESRTDQNCLFRWSRLT